MGYPKTRKPKNSPVGRVAGTVDRKTESRDSSVALARSLVEQLPSQFSYQDVQKVLADTPKARVVERVNTLVHYGCIRSLGAQNRMLKFEFIPGEY